MNMEPVPSNCPCCGLNIFQVAIVRQIKDWQAPDFAWRWMCQYCSSFFTWDSVSRKVRNIESRFKRGLRGNVDIESINNGKERCLIEPKIPDEFDPTWYSHDKHFKD